VDEARPYLQSYNLLCQPPWSDKDLEHKLADAVKAPLTKSYGFLRFSEAPKPKSKKVAVDREISVEEDDFAEDAEQERPWPTIDPCAFYGIFGRISRIIEPVTEADPVAILAQLLAAFGNVVGRNPFFTVEAVDHHANLFACIVGRSSKGRKGTSLSYIKRLLKMVDDDWVDERIGTGLSSGEGVIWAVRDPIFQAQRDKKSGEVTEVKIDNGIEDKRLFIGETEFAQALKVTSRPTNILSIVLRNAWDTGNLRTLVKNNPARATDAHISLVGHITSEELKRELNECELFNGFANRFMWLVSRRSKCLPEGGQFSTEAFNQFIALGQELCAVVGEASSFEHIKRDEEARAFWYEIYPALSAERPGLAGAVTNRAEAQVLRPSIVYALSDKSKEIKLPHLKAALAFWEYSQAGADYISGDRLADLNAQKIFDALRTHSEDMTRKEILDDVFQRHIDKAALALAFKTLESLSLAKKVIEQTGGRPSERWIFTGSKTAT
jgi:hypothetical protein